MKQFYVYVILDENKKPFYVGKGSGNRYKATLRDKRNSNIKQNKIDKVRRILGDNPKVKILIYGSEKFCLEIEKKLILKYGRKDNNTGCLTNTTNGGSGGCGCRRTKATRNKISKATKGPNHWAYGKRLTKEHVEKLSNSHIGIQSGEKHPLYGKDASARTSKRLKTMLSRQSYTITSPDGTIYQTNNLKKFCNQHQLNAGNMSTVANGWRTHSKGWKIEKKVSI